MQINANFGAYESYQLGFDYISSIQKQRAVMPSRNGLPVSNQPDQIDETTRYVLRMRKAIEAVKQSMVQPTATTEIEVAIAAGTTSAMGLSLSPLAAATPTTLQSTEEVNASQTSYSTTPPVWTGASTAQATISGEYGGSDGTDTLEFKVTRGGTHGSGNLQLKVYDSGGEQIDSINIGRNDPIDQQYTLSNGLVFSLGAGDLKKNDTFTLEVYDNVENAVAPDNPFNGTGSSDPNFQYGLDVTSGSFQVNGTTIDVVADDTLNSVLNKINQSAAGVTATFDAASETVLLTQNTPGSTPDIVLENDTSGFLAATKLDSAVPVPGTDQEPEKTLAEEGQFASVQSGSISVNGVSIDIDVNTDTLTDVLDRISASAADVTASFDSASQKVSLTSNNTDDQLIVDSGTTNFFPAAEISDGTYDPVNDTVEVQTGGVDVFNDADVVAQYAQTYNTELTSAAGSDQQIEATPAATADAKMLGTLVNIVADSMNALFDDSALTASSTSQTDSVRNDVRSAISNWFNSEGSQFKTDFGIQFDLEQTNQKVFSFSHNDFETALTTPQGQASIRNALFGIEADGLFNQLYDALTANTANLENEVGSTGLFLDALA